MADILISLKIADADVAEFKLGYEKYHPIPLDNEGNPTMTFKEWVQKRTTANLFGIYKAGKKLLGRDAAVINESIIS